MKFINESINDFLKPKSQDDIEKDLNIMFNGLKPTEFFEKLNSIAPLRKNQLELIINNEYCPLIIKIWYDLKHRYVDYGDLTIGVFKHGAFGSGLSLLFDLGPTIFVCKHYDLYAYNVYLKTIPNINIESLADKKLDTLWYKLENFEDYLKIIEEFKPSY